MIGNRLLLERRVFSILNLSRLRELGATMADVCTNEINASNSPNGGQFEALYEALQC
jgi:hypothetical protein